MKSNVQISVVMSVYNNKDTLPAALEGILSQEGVDLEFIIIDDGSTDGCGKILDEASSRDSRLKVVHKQNEGLTRALIEGCSMASAPWIARQDADDRSLPGRLAALLSAAQAHLDAVMISSWARYTLEGDDLLDEVRRTADPVEARHQILEQGIGPPAHGSVMFSKEAYEAVGGYRSAFYYGQDADLWLRMAERGGVVYVSEFLYEYALSVASISGAQRKQQEEFGRLGQRCRSARRARESEEKFLRQADVLREDILAGRIRRSSDRGRWVSCYHIGCLLEARNPRKAAEFFRRAVAVNPLALRPLIKLLACEIKRRGGAI